MQTFFNKTFSASTFRRFAVLLVAAALLAPASAFAGDTGEPQSATPVTTTTDPAATTTTEPAAATPTTGSEATTTTAGTTPTTTTTTAGTEKGDDGGTDDTLIAAIFIAFAMISVLVLFGYLGFSQWKFFEAARDVFTKTGVFPTADKIHIFPAGAVGAVATPPPLELQGPTSVTVGQPITFSAMQEGDEVTVEWDITPADGVSPASGKGSSITFQVSKAAVFTVSAKSEDGIGEGSVQVTAVAEPSKPSLPFIGENYGAALIAIVAVAGVVVLGLTEAIKGEAIATFFGALLGYAFGKTVQGSQSGTTTSPASGSDTQE